MGMMRQIFVILALFSMMQAEGKLLPKICKHFSDADICDKVEARGLKSDLKKAWDDTKDLFKHHHHHHHPSDEPKQKAEARGLKKDLKKAWDKTKHGVEKAYDKTKEGFKKGWDKTKDYFDKTVQP